MKTWVSIFTMMVVLLVGASSLFGQGGANGTILGTVTDPSAAAVPGVTVRITNIQTNTSQTTQTSSVGTYSIPYLKPGTYAVSVEHPGFSKVRVDNVVLTVGQSVRVDIVLKLGAVTDLVTVSGQTVRLDTDSSALGTLITGRQVVDLPLNGRDFQQLMLLGPGSSQSTGGANASPLGGAVISLMGSRSDSNSYLLDGLSINALDLQTPSVVPSIDAIQEFKVATGLYSAEFGNDAGQINMTTKSGANTVHGTAFDFFRNDALDARNYFDSSSQAKPTLRQNQFGYTLGGPVYIPKLYNGRNRTFFFANYEGVRIKQSTTVFGEVPTQDQLNGIFKVPITDPVTGQVWQPGQQIPKSSWSRVGTQFQMHMALPNTNLPQGNFVEVEPNPTVSNQQMYRIDQSIGAKNTIFGRITFGNYTATTLTNLLPESARSTIEPATNIVLSYTRTFSPNFVNQLRWGYLNRQRSLVGVPASADELNALGLQGLFSQTPGAQYPTFSLQGYSSFGGSANTPSTGQQTGWELSDSASINKGAHTITTGFTLAKTVPESSIASNYYGNWTFSGGFTGDPVADLLLGFVSLVTQVPQPTFYQTSPIFMRPHFLYVAPFIQDDFKVTPRLTLNLGLRWDFNTLPYEQNNYNAWLNTNIPGGGLYIASKKVIDEGLGGTVYQYGGPTPGSAQKMVFAPRIGLAFRPFNGDGTVVRTGYGVFFDTNTLESAGSDPYYPFGVTGTYTGVPGFTNVIADNLFPALNTPGPAGPEDLTFLFLQGHDKKNPYNQMWTLSIQHQLTGDTTLEVNYVGNTGTHQIGRHAPNQPFYYDPANPTPPSARLPYPNLGTVIESDYGFFSNYNAMNVILQHRARDLNLYAAYTWSRAIDDKSGADSVGGDLTGWLGPTDSHNYAYDRSRSDFDTGQRFISSFIYELPIGQGKHFLGTVNGPANLILGGWQINGITTFSLGTPYPIGAPDAGNLIGNMVNRANLVGNPYPSGFKFSPNMAFNTAAFSAPAPGIFGTSGRNILRSPGINNWDLSLFKSFPVIQERLQMQLRLESFNAFNHTQFEQPDNLIQDSTFGVISAARAARIDQIAAKLIW